MKRLYLSYECPFHETLEPKEFLPAPCQGALALEARERDADTLKLLEKINHKESEIQVRAERSFLHRLQGGCQIPAGVFSEIQKTQIVMIGAIFSLDGSKAVRWSTHGDKDKPEDVGEHLAEWLLHSGGDDILKKIREESY